jgi:hypothetical protein
MVFLKGELMNEKDKILFKALLLDGNETCELDTNTHAKFNKLLIELTKIKYDIRYCSNLNCPCHPETAIKELFKDNSLIEFLDENNLCDCIYELINVYDPVVADGIYNN